MSFENSFFRGLAWVILHAFYLVVAVMFALSFFISWEIPAAIVAICIIFEAICWVGDKKAAASA